ncbi:MAG: alkaline phosphatase family protein [Chloroflexi bacterium]|nr:alkaline phosphatase family protein [Chloroflexota bacterium]MCI0574952.1 alkaline phosphatase family protein [Chloroflexota bacterium]MCI0645862.1 alkaline phosphatase family protein [Chloroflexota bacterium]MCI0725717.1 alkaline phosphatase family protein [Chloroflexota bacterium]
MVQRKVAVFGLDGITFDLLQPWLDEGRLPNLARLLAEGASGRLRSTIPPVSASAWASFATGANPGQHGLVDFTYPSPDSYEIKISNGRTRAAPAIWEIVGQAGGQVGVVSMPMTYPPQPLNGFMLCSFLTPSQDSEYTYPPELKQELAAAVGPFPLHMSEKGRGTDPARFVEAVKQMEIGRARAVCHMLQTRPWDLFLYVIETTDNLQHEVWHLLDKSHPRHDPHLAAALAPKILDYYETVDRLLGEMVALVPEDALIVILSDHGFGPFHKFFHINNWLAAQGWLKFRRRPLSLAKRLAFRLGVTPINALRWVVRLRLSGMRKNVKRGRGRGMLRRLFLSFDDVDWSRTSAFSVGNFGQVYLNVRGQRPQGLVAPEAVERLRDDIAAAALALHDPADNARVVQQVYRREEIFHGPSVDRLPDLVLHTDRARYVSFGHADFGSNKILEPSTGQTGHHHMVGVVGLKGPGVRQGFVLEEPSILDLAPTILHYLGLPVPEHMDGQVLTQAFTDSFNEANLVRRQESDQGPIVGDKAYQIEEEEMVMAKLRDLGYVA